ncbi:T9SS type A sorting domain-containing protein [Pontibacter qinzhouensis]|uniref:T9SS type A sorting domain-containing protein n=1 Tax=Pontibacter qinzhouensis TaxID=2603253 RepID=A0A5C8K602_9BACT|nr:LamG-like jellyroll fold domain-containing protein [Pontibacter qinzhouensis]TXK46755.1 T9SS type A sorting domain-containing protein [Pontibacter qinzhouensis]
MKKSILLLALLLLVTFNLAAQFASVTNLSQVSITTNSGEKPQSKVWIHAGRHWAVLPSSNGTYLWRLDGTTWTNVLRLSTKTSSKADCKEAGDIAHILLYQGASSQMVSVEYVPAQNTYKLWSRRTSTVGLKLDKGVETATIDIDGSGRMWLASAGVNEINVRYSDSPYSNWSSPITIATGVTDDDICAVIAMPGKIGVLWSNQNTKRFGFKTHTDGASPTAWSADEVPASQSALNRGAGMADDHLNLAIASDGTLYGAVKTGYNAAGYAAAALLVRRPTGTWDPMYTVSEQFGTRPLIILNEALGKIRVVYTAQDGGGNILYRESATASISFGPQRTLISGNYDNATSTKQNFTSEVVVIASTSSRAVSVLATDVTSPTPPAVPVLASPANHAISVAATPTLTWISSAGAASYQLQVASDQGFNQLVFNQSNLAGTSAQPSGLSYNTNYYWRVRASNSYGSSNWSTAWRFTTALDLPAGILAGHWKMDEGSGSALLDDSGNGNHASTIGNPTWETGRLHLALKLNGSGQFATAPHHESLNITGPITLAAWVKPAKKITQYVVKKSIGGSVDGYELSLASSGHVFLRFNHATSGDTYRVNSTINYPTDGNTWMHIAGTYDGSVLRIYINGVENGSKTVTGSPAIKSNTQPLALGAQADGVYKLRGSLDDARIYSAALSAAEISELAGLTPAAFAATINLGKSQLLTEPADEFLAYPNPFTSRATLRFALPEDGTYTIAIYDSKGAQLNVLQQGHANAKQVTEIELDGTNLAKGLYIVRLQTQSESKSLKLILNH